MSGEKEKSFQRETERDRGKNARWVSTFGNARTFWAAVVGLVIAFVGVDKRWQEEKGERAGKKIKKKVLSSKFRCYFSSSFLFFFYKSQSVHFLTVCIFFPFR